MKVLLLMISLLFLAGCDNILEDELDQTGTDCSSLTDQAAIAGAIPGEFSIGRWLKYKSVLTDRTWFKPNHKNVISYNIKLLDWGKQQGLYVEFGKLHDTDTIDGLFSDGTLICAGGWNEGEAIPHFNIRVWSCTGTCNQMINFHLIKNKYDWKKWHIYMTTAAPKGDKWVFGTECLLDPRGVGMSWKDAVNSVYDYLENFLLSQAAAWPHYAPIVGRMLLWGGVALITLLDPIPGDEPIGIAACGAFIVAFEDFRDPSYLQSLFPDERVDIMKPAEQMFMLSSMRHYYSRIDPEVEEFFLPETLYYRAEVEQTDALEELQRGLDMCPLQPEPDPEPEPEPDPEPSWEVSYSHRNGYKKTEFEKQGYLKMQFRTDDDSNCLDCRIRVKNESGQSFYDVYLDIFLILEFDAVLEFNSGDDGSEIYGPGDTVWCSDGGTMVLQSGEWLVSLYETRLRDDETAELNFEIHKNECSMYEMVRAYGRAVVDVDSSEERRLPESGDDEDDVDIKTSPQGWKAFYHRVYCKN